MGEWHAPHRVSAGAAAGSGLAYATATLSFSLILFKPGNCNELKKPPLGDPR
jgi:hypothetical protein